MTAVRPVVCFDQMRIKPDALEKESLLISCWLVDEGGKRQETEVRHPPLRLPTSTDLSRHRFPGASQSSPLVGVQLSLSWAQSSSERELSSSTAQSSLSATLLSSE